MNPAGGEGEARALAREQDVASRTDVQTLCAATDALCTESSRLRDRDASARCQRARDSCAAARASDR